MEDPEMRARLSALAIGRELSQETKDKISKANKGLKRSAESRARHSAAAKRRTPEQLAKISDAIRAAAKAKLEEELKTTLLVK